VRAQTAPYLEGAQKRCTDPASIYEPSKYHSMSAYSDGERSQGALYP
jgi:hypothetical protein